MILVVDSGSTKADWHLVMPDGARKAYAGRGINPLHVPPADMLKTVQERIPAELRGLPVKRLFFYGAGCGASAATSMLASAFSQVFMEVQVEVLPDFLGAARALFVKEKGLVAILGTGSACGAYDGRGMVSSSKSLGYVLGDDGSATDLGKRLLRAFFYRHLPHKLERQLDEQGLTREKVLQSVYHSDAPAVYLASFLSFFVDNREDDFVREMLAASFNDFFINHVNQLRGFDDKLGVVGSVGFLFSDILRERAVCHGVEHVEVLQYPIGRLTQYHILEQ